MTADFLTGCALGLLAGIAARWSWESKDDPRARAEACGRVRALELARERPCAVPEIVERIVAGTSATRSNVLMYSRKIGLTPKAP